MLTSVRLLSSAYLPPEILMRARALVLLSTLILGLPLQIQAQAEKHAKTIVIMSALPKNDAYERATAALIGAGYVIEDANPVAITTAKRTFKNVWELQLRANVVSAGDSSRLVMSGAYWVPTIGVSNQAVESGHSGVMGRMWKELEIAADSVRGSVTTGP
jgi:hypothetical protein